MDEVINIINLFKREDRLLSFCNQARWQKFAFKIWNGIEDNLTPAQNINAAHKQIIQSAKDNNHERCIIAEDDCVFTGENSWNYFLSKIPVSYDMFFSMLYSAEIKDNRIINGFSGMTLYVVHKRFYDFFLSIPKDAHIDRHLGQFAHEKEYYVCNPYIAKQSGGYSDNMRKVKNYQVFEEQMNFYTG